MNRGRIRASLWTACVSLALVVVSPRLTTVRAMPHSPAPAAVQAADTVRVGCFGGSMALASGNLLTREGALVRYQKEFRASATYTFMRRDSAAAAIVFAELERIRFRTLRFNEIDNMTCSLELKDSMGEHSVNWKMGRPPAALEKVLAALDRTFGDDRPRWP